MLITFIRTLILYILVMLSVKSMGKRQIGQLQPFELTVTIMVSGLATLPMENPGIPIANGIIAILTILVAQVFVSLLSLKSYKARSLISGNPTILIQNGIINEDNLRKEMYTINDLIEQLRINNVPNIADVEFAILETNGQLSIIPKSQKRALNPEDLNVSTKYEGIPYELVVDGIIMEDNLRSINLSKKWLDSELKKFGVSNLKNLLFASIDSDGKLYYQEKTKNKKG